MSPRAMTKPRITRAFYDVFGGLSILVSKRLEGWKIAPLEIKLVEYRIHISKSDLEKSVLLQKYSSLFDLTYCPFPLFYYSYIVLRRSVGSICVKVKSKK